MRRCVHKKGRIYRDRKVVSSCCKKTLKPGQTVFIVYFPIHRFVIRRRREESICCGGSLGSLSLTFTQREIMTKAALENLYTSRADAIATACPLCQATFARYADRPVKDLAEIVNDQII